MIRIGRVLYFTVTLQNEMRSPHALAHFAYGVRLREFSVIRWARRGSIFV